MEIEKIIEAVEDKVRGKVHFSAFWRLRMIGFQTISVSWMMTVSLKNYRDIGLLRCQK